MRDCVWQQSRSAACIAPVGIPATQHQGIHNTCAQGYPIVNPVSDHGFTSLKRALRFIRQQRAEWVQQGVSIRFINGDRKHLLAQQSVNATRYWYERAVYSGFARYAELANLPMVAPAVALGLGKRKGASRHMFLSTQGF